MKCHRVAYDGPAHDTTLYRDGSMRLLQEGGFAKPHHKVEHPPRAYNSSASDKLLNELTFFISITGTSSAPDLLRDNILKIYD